MSEIREIREKKRELFKERQGVYNVGRFEKTHHCAQAKELPDDTEGVALAGRIVAMRDMGKLCFGQVKDSHGKCQFGLDVGTLGKEEYKFLTKNLDIGDFVGFQGKMFTTKKGEKTLRAAEVILLSKSLNPLPEKWKGLADSETCARQRYLDLIANKETWDRFGKRNRILRLIRNFLDKHEFVEVETPILQAVSSGASARPFITHHNALDIPLYLRIAPETYLKRLIVGGYDKVFELGKNFRNEGVDSSHLQEFTMLEFYATYWNYRDNMKFIHEMIVHIVQEVCGSLEVEYQGAKIDFSGEWKEVTYRDLLLEDTGIDLHKIEGLKHLKEEVQSKGIKMDLSSFVGTGALIDALYKRVSRPKLIQPMFLTKHPTELVPLARCSDENSKELDMFQVVVNSWEIVKAYSELVDPIEQRQRLMEQQALADAGDEEAMMFEDDFVQSMEYGMPPMSGLGLGVDRLVALLTDSKSIRDVVFFPSVRPPSADSQNVEEGKKEVTETTSN